MEKNIKNKKLLYDINREAQQNHHRYYQTKLINMNILQVKKFYFLIKVK